MASNLASIMPNVCACADLNNAACVGPNTRVQQMECPFFNLVQHFK